MTTTDRITALLKVAGKDDKAELKLLSNGVTERMRAYKKSSTSANLKDWDASKAALAETIERLWSRHFPNESAEVTVFERQKDALAWLKANGFKVSAGKFSQDVRSGECLKQSDRSIRLQDLKAYAAGLTSDRTRSEGSEEHHRRRDDAELKKIEADADQSWMKAEAMRRELDKKWMLREEADEETCVWVSRLRDATTYHLGKAALAIIHGCGGDPGRLPEVQGLIDEALAVAANEIANSDTVTVVIGEGEES